MEWRLLVTQFGDILLGGLRQVEIGFGQVELHRVGLY